MNKLRTIGGQWRSRQINIVDAPQLRPTPARVRETLFNWLQYDIHGKTCLDLYAGSGGLSFEAASRGALSVVQVENNALACRSLKENSEHLQAQQIKIIQQDVFRFLSGDAQSFDIVFLDPPFKQGLAIQTCQWLEDKQWLAHHAKIYVEVETHLDLTKIPENWQQLKAKTAGEVAYYLYQRH